MYLPPCEMDISSLETAWTELSVSATMALRIQGMEKLFTSILIIIFGGFHTVVGTSSVFISSSSSAAFRWWNGTIHSHITLHFIVTDRVL